ncbi:MAG: ABC transporter permease subunit [Myxococcota bacterium]
MRRIWHIARREWLEQLRQPALIGVMVTLHLIIALLVITALASIERLMDPAARHMIRPFVEDPTQMQVWLLDLAGSTLSLFTFLSFSQFLGLSSVLAGHSVLHDRQVGTLTFLLLAPVHRVELVLGKVLGAVGVASVVHLSIDGLAALATTQFPVAGYHPVWLPLSSVWWWSFLVTGPLWATFVGSVCVLISSQARDVRLAQQGVAFTVFFATLFSGLLVTWALAEGMMAQLGASVLGLVGLVATVAVAVAAFERDVN